MGAYLQNGFAKKQAESTRKSQIQDKKLSIVATFPAHLYKDVALISNRSFLRFDLEAWKRQPNHKAYLGRTRNEVLGLYGKLEDEYIKSPRSAPLLSEVKGWFCDQKILDRATQIDEQIEGFLRIDASKLTEEDIRQFGESTREKLINLVTAMIAEVKSPQCDY